MNDEGFFHGSRSPIKILEIDMTVARDNEEWKIDGKPVTGKYLAVLSYSYTSSSNELLIRINDKYSAPIMVTDFLNLQFPSGIEHIYLTNDALLVSNATVRLFVSDEIIPMNNSATYQINRFTYNVISMLKGAGSPCFFENVTLTGINRVCSVDNPFYAYPHGLNVLYDATYYAGQLTGYKAIEASPYFEVDPKANITYVTKHQSLFPPFDGFKVLEKTISEKYGKLILGDPETANGFVTVTSKTAGSAGQIFTAEVVIAATPDTAMSASVNPTTGLITVTLGTDASGNPDPAKNTAALIAAAVDPLTIGGVEFIDAVCDGTGAEPLTEAQAVTAMTGADDIWVRFYVFKDATYGYPLDIAPSPFQEPNDFIEASDWVLLSDLPAAGSEMKLNFYAMELKGAFEPTDTLRILAYGSY